MLSSLNFALPSIFKLNCNDFITGVKFSNSIFTLSLSNFSTFNSTETLLLFSLLSAEIFFVTAHVLTTTADNAIKLTILLLYLLLLAFLTDFFSKLSGFILSPHYFSSIC